MYVFMCSMFLNSKKKIHFHGSDNNQINLFLSEASEKMLKAWQENEEKAAAYVQVLCNTKDFFTFLLAQPKFSLA